MSDLAAPRARRLQRPSWRDPRLLVGVLLVLASTVAGSVLVARADDRVGRYAAAHDLVPGQQLRAADLLRVAVGLDDGVADYLPSEPPLGEGQFVLREVRAGELVPRSAVGPQSAVTAQSVALSVDATTVTNLAVGTLVDVYVDRPVPGKVGAAGGVQWAGPERVLERVPVATLPDPSGVLGTSGATRTVHVLVPRGRVRDLIADLDVGAKVTLVPVPGATAPATS